jgi:hypothetical protein
MIVFAVLAVVLRVGIWTHATIWPVVATYCSISYLNVHVAGPPQVVVSAPVNAMS